MPCFGGLTPFPKRFGGGRPRAKVILDSLNRQRGTGLDVTQSSPVYCDNIVAARALAAAWSTNQRLAYCWDPTRLTGTMIPRWEKILALTPDPSDSDRTRRARIAAIFALWGIVPTHQVLVDFLTTSLGSVFVAIEYITVANALINVPDGTYPFGVTTNSVPWSSTVAHILVKTQKPAGYTEGQYRSALAMMTPFMESVTPAWSTWSWYRGGASSYVVSGGPSAAGFFLDDPNNLDFEVFGS